MINCTALVVTSADQRLIWKWNLSNVAALNAAINFETCFEIKRRTYLNVLPVSTLIFLVTVLLVLLT